MPDISMRMAGKTIESVMKSNEVLLLRCEDGTEMQIAWLDDNGRPVKGTPKIIWFGRHVRAKTARLGMQPHSINGGAPG